MSTYLTAMRPLGFYEFFAGGGMARLGLGAGWNCLFANDFEPKKGEIYATNHGRSSLWVGDVAQVKVEQLPSRASLAWASFPCQDLSLAGNGKGLAGHRSGVFWPFWNLMMALKEEGRHPPLIALENVSGLISSNGGQDLTSLISALTSAGYRVGALEVDAAHFVPQSRPRLFVIAVARGVQIPRGLTGKTPNPAWHPSNLQNVVDSLEPEIRRSWLWWKLPMPTRDVAVLADVIEDNPADVSWDSAEATKKLLSMMTPANAAKVADAQASKVRQVGAVYKRTRLGVQRAEIRFDGLSGCLRTPSGGSSRQVIMVVEGKRVRSRLISARETARLMGLPDTYKLPARYNDAYHLTGDGVVVPVVAWLEQHIIKPLALSAQHYLETDKGRAPSGNRTNHSMQPA